jgi:hypothetical protein
MLEGVIGVHIGLIYSEHGRHFPLGRWGKHVHKESANRSSRGDIYEVF